MGLSVSCRDSCPSRALARASTCRSSASHAPGSLLGHGLQELSEHEPGIAGDRHVDAPVATERGRIDVDVHDARVRVPAWRLTVREHEVEARADHEHDVGRAERAGSGGADVVRMVVGHDPPRGMGYEHGGTQPLDQCDELVRRA